MRPCQLACRKCKPSGELAVVRKSISALSWSSTAPFSTSARRQDRASGSKTTQPEAAHDKRSKPKGNGRRPSQLADRDFFLSVLNASTTKREAKAYLSRFKPATKDKASVPAKVEQHAAELAGKDNYDRWRYHRAGVNLGDLYGPRAIEESPVFTQQPLPQSKVEDVADELHVALVKIREPQLLDDKTLDGIALTLSQLARLRLRSVVVIECNKAYQATFSERPMREWRSFLAQQAERIVAMIMKHNVAGARYVDSALGYGGQLEEEVPTNCHVRGRVEVSLRDLLVAPLNRGAIPIVPPMASSLDTQSTTRVDADDVVLALTRELAGFRFRYMKQEDPEAVVEDLTEKAKSIATVTSVDRIILLDPLGGIPSTEHPDGAHVFVNLEQEYEEVRDQLVNTLEGKRLSKDTLPSTSSNASASVLGNSNPLTKFVETQFGTGAQHEMEHQAHLSQAGEAPEQRHLQNLNLVQRCLKLLPPLSSGLITTPWEAAIAAKGSEESSGVTGVRTRGLKNPLIHNLLTNKPAISSSLPPARLTRPSGIDATETAELPSNPGTFLLKGMPLTLIPHPKESPWQHPSASRKQIDLKDPQIDFPKLLHLIEDSFNRELDVPHYLERIKDRVAGIIIAGKYEGGAILTWELPSHISESQAYAEDRMVPYLDKFAVLKKSQGIGGVADIVFKAMVRTCFPEGVCWRSRKNNPANKWYFERSVGTWKLPGTQWTMFWTTEDLPLDKTRWEDYVAVCKAVEPSWVDVTTPAKEKDGGKGEKKADEKETKK